MSEQYINYGSFDSWAGTVDKRNTELLNRLHEIQRLIKSLEGEYESNAAVEIRSKIQGMEPRFQSYHDVVDNYAKFLRNTAAEYKATEQANTSNAEQFI
ncbi:MAG: WXG100 family type VII secretion target [Lachnospiraceae bacterium]|nr:WXG100 family type VII secretion target [Lachnospiraceae bacterium]